MDIYNKNIFKVKLKNCRNRIIKLLIDFIKLKILKKINGLIKEKDIQRIKNS